jgi:hypothetical protein
LGSARPALRAFDRGRRIVLAVSFRVEEAIELADSREPPRDRGRGKSARGQASEMIAYCIAVRSRDHAPVPAQIAGEILKVAPVGVKRVRGGAALGRQHVEIEVDQPLVGWLHANRPA